MKRLLRNSNRRQTPLSRKSVRPQIEALETRLALNGDPVMTDSVVDLDLEFDFQPVSGIFYNQATQEVNVYGTDLNDKVEISQQILSSPDINLPPLIITQVDLGSYQDVNGQLVFVTTHTEMFVQGVTKVNFHGFDGDDEFRNHAGVDCAAFGGAGNDLLFGGSGHNELHGQADNDSLYAGGGFGALSGGDGDDLLVSIGGSSSILTGGDGKDSFWLDSSDAVADASSWETANGHVHEVYQFMSYSIDGGPAIPVSLELDGQSLDDPLPMANGFSLQNFAANPLFAGGGPTKDDIFQGGVGDCYFMATLSAIADANPDYIKQMVIDLGDGTYAVRFHDASQEIYVRVDADLWVDGGMLEYADLGQEASLWVPIVEKAYAFFRKGQGTYASIAYGNSTTPEHLNLDYSVWQIQDGVDPQDVVDWVANGSPSGALQDVINAGVVSLLNWIQSQIDLGMALTTGARAQISNSTAIALDDPTTDGAESTYRRGQHVYHVDGILKDADGNPTGLVLRDPYGVYRTLTDFTRIYFCVGRAAIWDVREKAETPSLDRFEFIERVPLFFPEDPYVLTEVARFFADPDQNALLPAVQPTKTAEDSMIEEVARYLASEPASIAEHDDPLFQNPFRMDWEMIA